MYRRILIPTDFSTASEWVFDDAIRIAGSTGAELVILHVRMTRTSQPGELRFPADPSLYEYAEQLELERLRDRVKRVNASVATRMVVKQGPDPGKEICRTATSEEIGLIVIATHARHHVAHLLVGSTTHAVVAGPPCPVLAIRYGVRKRKSMQKIVVPVHFDQKSHAALELAVRVARHERGEVHLVTVCSDEDRSRAEGLLAEQAAHFEGVATKHAILRGTEVERELVKYGEKIDADAVFLNASGKPSEKKLDIIRHAPVPVMVVP
ncbi:MAG TPA: universal stress protein [Thermoanaerobaculia bacterium]